MLPKRETTTRREAYVVLMLVLMGLLVVSRPTRFLFRREATILCLLRSPFQTDFTTHRIPFEQRRALLFLHPRRLRFTLPRASLPGRSSPLLFAVAI